jgi:hypothetical protein
MMDYPFTVRHLSEGEGSGCLVETYDLNYNSIKFDLHKNHFQLFLRVFSDKRKCEIIL